MKINVMKDGQEELQVLYLTASLTDTHASHRHLKNQHDLN